MNYDLFEQPKACTQLNETGGIEKNSPNTAETDCRNQHIQALLDENPAIWQGSKQRQSGGSAGSSGYPNLDSLLPQQGWPEQGLVEIISAQQGIGELQLLTPLLRRFSQQGKPILWVTPPRQLYAPALAQAGIDLESNILIRPQDSCQQALWSAEKALQASECALVLIWQNWFSARVMRRLQLAAQNGKTLGVLFHKRAVANSPSSLQLQLDAVRQTPSRALDVSILKARGYHHRGQRRLLLNG